MKHLICHVEKQDYSQLIVIWEESVRTTHDFLPDEEIHKLKSLILNNYFDAVLFSTLAIFCNSVIASG